MTKQTLATTLLLLSLAAFFVAPAALPSSADIEGDTPVQETTAVPEVTTPAPETTAAVTTPEPAETVPPEENKFTFDKEITSPEEALDLIRDNFYKTYTEKVSDMNGSYHYSHPGSELYILTVADGNVPYKIIMAVTMNDEPLTSAVYYVTPDGERTVVETDLPEISANSEPAVTEAGMGSALPYTIDGLNMEIASPDEALDLVQKYYAAAYTQRHSYETIGTYYTIPSNPKARLEVDRFENDVYVVHQYIEDSDKDDVWYAVTSKDGKTSIGAYNP